MIQKKPLMKIINQKILERLNKIKNKKNEENNASQIVKKCDFTGESPQLLKEQDMNDKEKENYKIIHIDYKDNNSDIQEKRGISNYENKNDNENKVNNIQ